MGSPAGSSTWRCLGLVDGRTPNPPQHLVASTLQCRSARRMRRSVWVHAMTAVGHGGAVSHSLPGTLGAASGERGVVRRLPILLVVFAGAAAGLWTWAFLEKRPPLDDYAFLVWGCVVVALGVTSGVVFAFGLDSRAVVDAIQPIDWRPIRLRALAAAAAASAMTCLNLVVDPKAGTARGIGLTVLAIIGGVPAATVLLGIKAAVRITAQSLGADLARVLQSYLDLRILALRLLTALGPLVALTTFALGASNLAQGAWPGLVGVEVIIVFGAFGTSLVGLVYLFPRLALRDQARAMLRELAPLTGREASVLRQELDEREKVERQLGLQSGLMGELQAGIVILSPLLAAAVALLFPSK
jgi:hypothetical protein